MRRRTIHLGFGAAALLCAGMAAYEAAQLLRLERVNDAVARVTVPQGDEAPPKSEPTAVTLARALAVSKGGDVDRSVKEFSRVIARTPPDANTRAALYDLGNLYLRKGAALVNESPAASLPFIELAKQRYRDLLRADPEQWDARYNLERALRMAPESQSVFSDVGRSTEHRPNIKPRDDVTPPDLP